ncbi:MAG: hypothetical protein QW666_01720 [Candidatus Woesearchaeota archaeon]
MTKKTFAVNRLPSTVLCNSAFRKSSTVNGSRLTVYAIVIFILIVLLANNMHAVILEKLGIRAEYKEPAWHEVEEWEKEVCSKWGGTGTAGSQGAITSGRKLSWASMTATVQGKKTRTKEKEYIYEVAWYIDSFSETTNYEILMINPAKPELRHLVDSGSLAPEKGTIGYETYNMTQDFTHIKLTYTGGSITTPIIEAGKK